MDNTTVSTSAEKNAEIQRSGTGTMQTLVEGIREFEKRGYTENIVPKYDHFSMQNGDIVLYPKDIVVDDIVRFENSSDPADQSILYAISNLSHTVKGLYVDSFGAYHDDLSTDMQNAIQISRMVNKKLPPEANN